VHVRNNYQQMENFK